MAIDSRPAPPAAPRDPEVALSSRPRPQPRLLRRNPVAQAAAAGWHWDRLGWRIVQRVCVVHQPGAGMGGGT